MLRLAALAAALIAALPVGAEAQDPPTPTVDPAVWEAVQPVLDAAARDSLPVEALRAKVLEGAAKRVSAERIRAVVQDMADEFRSVRSAVRDAVPGVPLAAGEVVAGAMALRQGVPLPTLARIWEARPAEGAESLEVPLVVLTEIVRRGVEVGDAEALMTHVVSSRVPLHAAAQIPGRMDGLKRPDVPPGQALDRALRALNIPRPPGKGRGPPR